MNRKEKLNILKVSLAKVVKELCNGKAPTTLAVEYGISSSTMSLILQGKKDPQISTFIKLSEAFNKQPWEVMKIFTNILPEGFKMTEE